MSQGWSDNQLGDLWLGGKFNLMSEWKQKPMALAVRGMVKLPTAKDDEEGVGTGKADFAFDCIASKEINQRVELSGYGGFIFRGDPDDVDLSDGFRWGFGAGFPTRKSLRADRRAARRDRSSTMSSTPASRGSSARTARIPPLVSDSDTATHFTARADVDSARAASSPAPAPTGASGWTAASVVGSEFERRVGRRVRLPGAHRLSPGRARLHAAAAATAAAAAGADGQAGSRARRQGVVQPVHG